MRFTPQFLEDLRERLPCSEVVGRRVKLKKAGREWKGLSPFQQEKSPSFFVNDEKMAWFDFSSGKNGNIFDFIMQTEGVPFPEAVERVAAMAGVALPAATPEAARHEQRRKTLYDVMDMAATYFVETLAGRTGARGRGYFADRGLSPATQLQFRLGYAPADRFALKEYLGAAGIPVDDMVECGLLIGGEDIPVPYDRFRDRVMFPITDVRGRVIAFGGRALEKDQPAKYLNSPETPLFHKSDNLYNQHLARKAAHEAGRAPASGQPAHAAVVVVEGYVDVIAMVGAGFPASVAPLGTALTENQLALLWKMSDEPVLCFDGDKAGQKAAFRAAEMALPHLLPGKSLKFALLPEGQDPDDLARSGGRGAIEEVIRGARGLADLIWSREIAGGDFATPERRAALEARINEIANGIRDETVKRYYRQDLVERLRTAFGPAQRPFGGGQGRFAPGGGNRPGFGGRPPFQQNRAKTGVMAVAGTLVQRGPYQVASPQLATSSIMRGQRSTLSRREALILQSLLNHPWLLHDHLEEVAALELAHPEAIRLRAGIIASFAHDKHHNEAPDEAAANIRHDVEKLGLSEPLQRLDLAITTKDVWGAQPGAAREDVLSTWHQLVSLHRQWHSLLRELKDAEAALGEDATEQTLGWLRDVKARLAEVDGIEALIEGFGDSSGRTLRSV